MSDRTDERLDGVWLAWSELWLARSAPTAKWIATDEETAAEAARAGWETVDVGALAADAAETQKLREEAKAWKKAVELAARIAAESVAETMQAELDAAVAETQTLREAWTAVLRQRDRAIRERDAAVADRDRLAEAAEPFRQFAAVAVEVDEGAGQTHPVWVKRMGGERVCDWFGPSDFATIDAALAGREGN